MGGAYGRSSIWETPHLWGACGRPVGGLWRAYGGPMGGLWRPYGGPMGGLWRAYTRAYLDKG